MTHRLLMYWMSGALVAALAAGCGEVMDETPASPDAPGATSFAIGGAVTGFAGRDLVLVLDSATGSEELAVTANGAFQFPSAHATGAAYTVSIRSQPVCPVRRCELANGAGTVADADVTSIAITCETPKQRLVSANWGEASIFITDDIASIANNALATPRILRGIKTELGKTDSDAIAVDAGRDLIYVATTNLILVFDKASTTNGDIAPVRRIRVSDEMKFIALELDAARDRLYATGYLGLYAFDLASTLDGYTTPAVRLLPPTAYDEISAVTFDRTHDRLYLGTYAGELFAYDSASTLLPRTVPTRKATWANWGGPSTIAYDECEDRLYLGSNQLSPNGFNMFVFDDPAVADGPIAIETASTAQLRTAGQQSISATLDTEGTLYYWTDSPTDVFLHSAPATFSGATAVMTEKTVRGVVARGYGLAVVAY